MIRSPTNENWGIFIFYFFLLMEIFVYKVDAVPGQGILVSMTSAVYLVSGMMAEWIGESVSHLPRVFPTIIVSRGNQRVGLCMSE